LSKCIHKICSSKHIHKTWLSKHIHKTWLSKHIHKTWLSKHIHKTWLSKHIHKTWLSKHIHKTWLLKHIHKTWLLKHIHKMCSSKHVHNKFIVKEWFTNTKINTLRRNKFSMSRATCYFCQKNVWKGSLSWSAKKSYVWGNCLKGQLLEWKENSICESDILE
jgi:hypothetical protein